MEINTDPSVVFEAENDDDAFYADIRRQILLLTSEDNEDLLAERRGFSNNNIGISSANNGGSKRADYSFKGSSASAAAAPASNFCSWETQSYHGSPPVWLENLWKHGKGTGVFIPQVACRKNHRSGRRMNNGRRRIYRQVVNQD